MVRDLLRHRLAVPVGFDGDGGANHHLRCSPRSILSVFGTIARRLVAVGQLDVARRIHGGRDKIRVQCEDLSSRGPVRLLARRLGAKLHDLAGLVVWRIAAVDAMNQTRIYDMIDPSRRTKCSVGGIDTGNARDQHVGLRQI